VPLKVAGLAALLLITPVVTQAQNLSAVRVSRTTAVLAEPDGSANAVGSANPGDILEVLDQRSGWYLVRPPAGSTQTWRTGWINAASVEPMPGSIAAAAPSQPAPAAASSKPRKGFIIGFGGGVGLYREPLPAYYGYGYGYTYSTAGGGTANNVGLATDLQIGYAPTDQVLVYYLNSVQFSNSANYDIVGLTGVGVTYLLRPRSPSWYVTGGIGAATGAEVDYGSGTVGPVDRGRAFSVGGGYEFARHWFLGGDAMFLSLNQTSHTVLRGTITWIFY
jgi:Bacterial SH3 domain